MASLGNPEHCLWWGVVIDAKGDVVVGGAKANNAIKQPHRATAEKIARELYEYVRSIPGTTPAVQRLVPNKDGKYSVESTTQLDLLGKQGKQ